MLTGSSLKNFNFLSILTVKATIIANKLRKYLLNRLRLSVQIMKKTAKTTMISLYISAMRILQSRSKILTMLYR